ncbi:MAG TPA: type IV toxin-antitoxin system AbiEi family antitoxin domain-containing protein [Solirubrobacteraceae bacterium]|jgi:very-short-patch-repair endonuclease
MRHTARAGSDRVTSRPTVGPETTHLVEILAVRHPAAISGDREDRIAAIAGLQRGRVSRDQLRAAGIPDRTVSRLAANGFLRRVHKSVYAVGHTAPAPLADETSALLACGQHAVLSHMTAAKLWSLILDGDATIHVTVRGRHGACPNGVHVHRTNQLKRGEVRIVEGLPVTSPLRTLIDLASTLGLRPLERAVEEVMIRKLASERQLRAAVADANGRHGIAGLKAILAANREPGVTRSKAEHRFRELIRAAQLPAPRTNVRIHGYEVDAYWPEFGVVVEVQSQKFHATRAALERDTRKAAKLTAAGLTVSYVTWLQMEREPFAVVARVAQLLARVAGTSAPRNPALDLPLRARAGG